MLTCSFQNMDFVAYEKALKERKNDFFASHLAFCQKVLEFEPGQLGIISNGRVSYLHSILVSI